MPAHSVCWTAICLAWMAAAGAANLPAQSAGPLEVRWSDDYLVVSGPGIPGGDVRIHYLEAYCRAGSTDADWVAHTVIGHQTKLLEQGEDHRSLRLRCSLKDGVTVEHSIVAGEDEVDFRLVAHNPTNVPSQAVWAQPCVRVDGFTEAGPETYVGKCFVFLDEKLTRLPTQPWATKARYTPGQVFRAPGIDADDVNPRPLSPLVPSNGLMGCFSADERWILATAWQPYQELFQGVATCLHSDFRIGGLEPGERKEIRGKLYMVPADANALVQRYRRDFPMPAAKRQ